MGNVRADVEELFEGLQNTTCCVSLAIACKFRFEESFCELLSVACRCNHVAYLFNQNCGAREPGAAMISAGKRSGNIVFDSSAITLQSQPGSHEL